MVVDDVEQHGEALARARRRRAAAGPAGRRRGRGRRRQVDAVVAPAVLARERGHRHQLDRGDAELAQAARCGIAASNVPSVGERADVQLVDDASRRARAPRSRRRVHANAPGVEHARGPAQPVRAASASTGRAARAVDRRTRSPRPAATGERRPRSTPRPASASAWSRPPARSAIRSAARRPDAERGRAVTDRTGAERSLEGQGWIGHWKRGLGEVPTAPGAELAALSSATAAAMASTSAESASMAVASPSRAVARAARHCSTCSCDRGEGPLDLYVLGLHRSGRP